MQIKPWMEVQYSNGHEKDIARHIGRDDYSSRDKSHKKVKSLKRARKVEKFWNRHNPKKWQDRLLNELYRYYRPGSRAESCGLGNFWMGGVVLYLDSDTGYVTEIDVKDQSGKKGCDILGGGGCVSHGKWYETVYHESEAELNTYLDDGLLYPKVIGNQITSEFGVKLDIEGSGPIKVEYSNKWPRIQT